MIIDFQIAKARLVYLRACQLLIASKRLLALAEAGRK